MAVSAHFWAILAHFGPFWSTLAHVPVRATCVCARVCFFPAFVCCVCGWPRACARVISSVRSINDKNGQFRSILVHFAPLVWFLPGVVQLASTIIVIFVVEFLTLRTAPIGVGNGVTKRSWHTPRMPKQVANTALPSGVASV